MPPLVKLIYFKYLSKLVRSELSHELLLRKKHQQTANAAAIKKKSELISFKMNEFVGDFKANMIKTPMVYNETPKKSLFIKKLEKILSRKFNPLLSKITDTIERNKETQQKKESLEIIQGEWSDVAMISDRILCYTFTFITISGCILIFLNSPHALPLSNW